MTLLLILVGASTLRLLAGIYRVAWWEGYWSSRGERDDRKNTT